MIEHLKEEMSKYIKELYENVNNGIKFINSQNRNRVKKKTNTEGNLIKYYY